MPARNKPWLLAFAAVVALGAVPRLAPAGEPKYPKELILTIQEAMDRYNSLSEYDLPPLEGDDWKELLEGKVVRLQWKQPVPGEINEDGEEEPKERRRVVALKLIDEPLVKVWLAALDPHFLGNDNLTEARVQEDGHGGSTWYQFMDLPWPVRNRHWIIDIEKQSTVAAATDDEMWEQTWNLVVDGEPRTYEIVEAGLAEGIDIGEAEGAKYLEANTGAWGMISLDENRTLLTYQLTVVLGGWIPDRLAAKFAKNALKDLLNSVADFSHDVFEHYDADHTVIYGGDGLPVAKRIEDTSLSGVTGEGES